MGDERILEIVLRARDEASKVIQSASSNVRNLSDDLKTVGRTMAAVGAGTAAATTYFVKQAGAFEQYQVALSTILGDADKAEEHFQVLKDFAKATPFNFEEVVKNNNLLLATGAHVEDVIDEMTMLGNVAAGLSVPIERIALNFGQVRAQGRLTGRELRDFAVAGIPILDELAEMLGVSKEEVTGLIEAGEIGFPVVQQAFRNMTSEGGMFHNLMQEQSKTTLGQWSNLQDSLQQTAATIGTVLLPTVNELLQALIPIIEKAAVWASENQKLVKVLIAAGLALGVIGSTLLVLFPIISSTTAIISLLSAAISGTTAVIGMIVGVLGGPLTIAIVAASATIGGFALAWSNNWLDIQGKTRWAVDRIKVDMADLEGTLSAYKIRFQGFRSEVSDTANAIKIIFQGMASQITSALRSIKFPHVKVGKGSREVLGQTIEYPTIDVDWYEKGGFVPRTGLAMLHAGEFVMSKDMLSGNQPVPSYVTNNNNTPINIGAVYVQDQGDIEGLTHQLAFMLKTGGRY